MALKCPAIAELRPYWSLIILVPDQTPQGDPSLPLWLKHDPELFNKVLFLILGTMTERIWKDLYGMSIVREELPPNVFMIEQKNPLAVASVVSSFLTRERTKVLFVDKEKSLFQ